MRTLFKPFFYVDTLTVATYLILLDESSFNTIVIAGPILDRFCQWSILQVTCDKQKYRQFQWKPMSWEPNINNGQSAFTALLYYFAKSIINFNCQKKKSISLENPFTNIKQVSLLL